MVVIAISTYTEPAPMLAQAPVDESPQAWEPEKEEGPDSFANILAGLLRKTGVETASDSGIQAAPLADFDGEPGADLEALTDDEAAEASRLLGKNAQDDGKTGKLAAKTDKDSEENEISAIDLSVELLLNPYVDQPVQNTEGAALEDFPEEEGGNFLAGLEQAEAARMADANTAAVQTPDAAFAETSEEAAILAEALKKISSGKKL